MRLLLDTHAFLWFVAGDERLNRDPFDRLLIAQALTEDLPLLSGDSNFDAYGVTRWW